MAAPRYNALPSYLETQEQPEIWQNILDVLQGGRLQGRLSPEEQAMFDERESKRKEEFLSDLVRSGISGGQEADFLDDFVRGLERDRTVLQQERIGEAIQQALSLGSQQEARSQYGYTTAGNEAWKDYQSRYNPWALKKTFQYNQALQQGNQSSWQDLLFPALGMGVGTAIGGPLGGKLLGGLTGLFGGGGSKGVPGMTPKLNVGAYNQFPGVQLGTMYK